MTLASDVAALDAVAQAALVAAGEMRAVELVEAAIERIEAVDPAINSVVLRRFDRALDEARALEVDGRPLGGVPTLFKDVTAIAGEPRDYAVGLAERLGHVDSNSSNVVTAMREAGLVALGKTSLPQFCGGIATEPALYGACHNPWNLDYSVGGSSGGSAAAVAAGMVPIAHGTDGGGSVRIPASLCGLVGLKPTRGRISIGPEFTDTEGCTVASVLSRTVRDTAVAVDAISGHRPGDPWYAPPLPQSLSAAAASDPTPLRIGMWTQSPEFHATVDPQCIAACSAAAKLLESLGHSVEPAYPKVIDAGMTPSFMVIATALIARDVEDYARRVGVRPSADDLEPTLALASEVGRQVSALDYQDAIADLRVDVRAFASWWAEGWDLLLTPTLAVPPYRIGATSPPRPDAPWPDINPWIPFTGHFNLSGLPAITLPLGWSADNLPIGVQLGAALGREDLLVAVAAQLERAAPWADRWPEHSYVARAGAASA